MPNQNQKGEVAVALTLLTIGLITLATFVGSKLVRKGPKFNPKAQTAPVASCTGSCSIPNSYCTTCLDPRERQSCAENAGVTLVYQCKNGEWQFQYPECQTACAPSPSSPSPSAPPPQPPAATSTPQPPESSPPPTSSCPSLQQGSCSSPNGTIINSCVREECDSARGTNGEWIKIEQICQNGQNSYKPGRPTGRYGCGTGWACQACQSQQPSPTLIPTPTAPPLPTSAPTSFLKKIKLTGTVYNQENSRTIRNANVTLNTYSVYTNLVGKYEIELYLRPGATLSLSASKIDYETASQTKTLTEEDFNMGTLIHNFYLNPLASPTPIPSPTSSPTIRPLASPTPTQVPALSPSSPPFPTSRPLPTSASTVTTSPSPLPPTLPPSPTLVPSPTPSPIPMPTPTSVIPLADLLVKIKMDIPTYVFLKEEKISLFARENSSSPYILLDNYTAAPRPFLYHSFTNLDPAFQYKVDAEVFDDKGNLQASDTKIVTFLPSELFFNLIILAPTPTRSPTSTPIPTPTSSTDKPPLFVGEPCPPDAEKVQVSNSINKLLHKPHQGCTNPTMIVIHWSAAWSNAEATYWTFENGPLSCHLATDKDKQLQMLNLYQNSIQEEQCVGGKNDSGEFYNNFTISNEITGVNFDAVINNPGHKHYQDLISSTNRAIESTCWLMEQYNIEKSQIYGHYELDTENRDDPRKDPGEKYLEYFLQRVENECK